MALTDGTRHLYIRKYAPLSSLRLHLRDPASKQSLAADQSLRPMLLMDPFYHRPPAPRTRTPLQQLIGCPALHEKRAFRRHHQALLISPGQPPASEIKLAYTQRWKSSCTLFSAQTAQAQHPLQHQAL